MLIPFLTVCTRLQYKLYWFDGYQRESLIMSHTKPDLALAQCGMEVKRTSNCKPLFRNLYCLKVLVIHSLDPWIWLYEMPWYLGSHPHHTLEMLLHHFKKDLNVWGWCDLSSVSQFPHSHPAPPFKAEFGLLLVNEHWGFASHFQWPHKEGPGPHLEKQSSAHWVVRICSLWWIRR